MALYRIVKKLHVGKGHYLEPGSWSRLEWLDGEGITRLERVGAVGRVNPPPLIALPGWQRRARKVKEVTGGKIENAEQFLEADSKKLAELVRVKETTIEKWKKEVLGWLTADPATGG